MTDDPLQKWEGDFGEAYTKRNKDIRAERARDIEQIFDKAQGAQYILEVGSNIGHNLQILEALGYDAIGVEPNPYAVKQGMKRGRSIVHGNGLDLPFADRSFDLVFTCGVLMHIPLTDCRRVIEEMIRVSKRYILTIEWEAHQTEEEEVVYRGNQGMLWKRDYDKILRAAKLYMVSHGYTTNYEGALWRLFRK